MKINRRPEGGILDELAAELAKFAVVLSPVESIDLTLEEYQQLVAELGVTDQLPPGGMLGAIQGIPILIDGLSPLARPGIVVPGGPVAH